MQVCLPWSTINNKIKHKVRKRIILIKKRREIVNYSEYCILCLSVLKEANENRKITHVIYNRVYNYKKA